MSKVTIRTAKRNDSADLAILDNIAGHGIPLMFWAEQSNSKRMEDALAFGRDRLADDDAFYNWKKARVAVENDQVVGMTTNYIMPDPDNEPDESKRNSEAFKPIYELHDLCAGDWYLDGLAVYPSGQRKGIGRLLLDDSIKMGLASGAKNMSLIVEDTNTSAFWLYRSLGFSVVAQRDFVPFEGALEIYEWILMSRPLA